MPDSAPKNTPGIIPNFRHEAVFHFRSCGGLRKELRKLRKTPETRTGNVCVPSVAGHHFLSSVSPRDLDYCGSKTRRFEGVSGPCRKGLRKDRGPDRTEEGLRKNNSRGISETPPVGRLDSAAGHGRAVDHEMFQGPRLPGGGRAGAGRTSPRPVQDQGSDNLAGTAAPAWAIFADTAQSATDYRNGGRSCLTTK